MKFVDSLLQRAAPYAAAAIVAATLGAHAPASAYTWDPVAMGGGGFVSAVIPAKSQAVVYARTDVGGAFRWDSANSRWIPLLDWVADDQTGYLGVESLAVDPKNAANLYLYVGIDYFNGGKSAILRSTDYGASWTTIDVTSQFKAHGNGMGRQNGERLVVDPGSSNVLYLGTRRNGLFKSTNSGSSWSQVTSLPVSSTPNDNGVSVVMADPSSVSGGVAQRLFVGVSHYGSVGANFYRSDNGGASFSAVSGAPSGLMPQRAAFDGAGNLYVTYANGAGPHGNQSGSEPMDTGQIWKYTIANGAWTNVTPAGVTRAFSGISVDPNNNQRLVASTVNQWAPQGSANGDHVYISTNGGASWTDVINRGYAMDTGGISWIAGNSIHWTGTASFDPSNSKSVWITSGNGVFKTSDIDAATTTWTFVTKGLEETVPLNIASIPGGPLLTALGDVDGFRHYNTLTYTNPMYSPTMGTTTGLAVAPGNVNTVVRTGSKMYTSTNGGVNWSQTTMNGVKGQVALSASGSALLHSPENSTTTYRSTNLGAGWSAVGGLSVNNARPVADPSNANKFYVYNPSDGSFMISTDAGASFWKFNTLATGGSDVIRAAPGVEGDVWVPLYGNGLVRTTSSGWQFNSIANVTYCAAVGFGKAASGATYPTVFIWGTVGGVRGLFRSTDAGASWTRINDNAHQYGGPGNGRFVVGDMNTFGVVYMSTAGRGVVMGRP
ncbi:exo-alpha-sialidase [Duganella sp. FT92W]|uniref:Exo-alpha-sialidase n=1 Tax=Pseudoduganella rivuli TaxID=2666085 RepID=A0A7X2IMR2_9BURK|nr:exo-alpha-sialidase [Pseudoduganella rivuli]MRV72598.1 exo-alpha-sialidase [Pseudoduganella rivuli]